MIRSMRKGTRHTPESKAKLLGNQNGKPRGKVEAWDGMWRDYEEAFPMWVEKTDTCWLWSGPLTAQGYGSFAQRGKLNGHSWSGLAHRYAMLAHQGHLTPGHEAHHVCGNRLCVRIHPEHVVELL